MPSLRAHPVAAIAIAQLCGTSLWFSANSAAPDLMRAWGIRVSGIGLLTNAVQFGFILGTSAFALRGLADTFPASRIFVLSAVRGAFFNGCFALFSNGLASAAAPRFLVGISLAGIYPIRHEAGRELGTEANRARALGWHAYPGHGSSAGSAFSSELAGAGETLFSLHRADRLAPVWRNSDKLSTTGTYAERLNDDAGEKRIGDKRSA